ncbi:MAG TPA: outer membrane beta-barrel protein [Burkholderiaceae bacterium]|nr:outer membrane beta-barrel protein [Burkholderiaceae bacterium]
MRLILPALCLIACSASSPSLAEDIAPSPGFYVGAFGGTGASIATSLQQRGAVHINDRISLPIHAKGSTESSTRVGLGGLQLGYEWDSKAFASNWAVRPALEVEGIYIGKHSPTGVMPVRPQALGTQYVTVPTTAGLLLANAVFTFETPYSRRFLPYVGIGAGVARVSIKGSDSYNPMEPGINHFNSGPDASDTAFTMQLRAGFKMQMSKRVHIFTEYRYLSINSTRYTFGATDYPGLHLPTNDWRVDMGRQKFNLFVAGLQYRF